MKESFCSCCGASNWKYNSEGHDKECIWYEDEMYRLAKQWLDGTEFEEHPFKCHIDENGNSHPMILRADWKKRYDLIVSFLVNQIGYIKEISKNEQ